MMLHFKAKNKTENKALEELEAPNCLSLTWEDMRLFSSLCVGDYLGHHASNSGALDGVFLLPGCCDPFNEKALRASRGASFQLPVVSGSWNNLECLKEEFQMRLLAGHPEHEGLVKPVSSLSPNFCDSLSDTPLCLVLGSEGSGLSEKSLQASELVSIPMAGEYESLNVSVAGGIFLYMLQPKNR